MTPNEFVIGVDGGNTKTTVVVADRKGRVIGVAHGGCSDIHGVVSPTGACAELTRTIEAALASANCAAGDLAAGVFSLAGADWPEDNELLTNHLTNTFAFQFEPLVVNDALGGLRSAAPDWEGIALICGTGNAVAARRRDGASFHLGFWPDTIGGVTFSRAALDAVQRDHLGLGPATSLTARALELYEATDPIDLLHLFTRIGGLGEPDMVRMSPVLLDEADAGDEVAWQIVSEGGKHLGGQGRISAERIDLAVAGSLVVMSGGLFRHPSTVLESAIMNELPGAVSARTTRPPVVGALLAAMDMIGEDWDADQLHRSLQTFEAFS